ncbi:hypothetical protein VSS82_07140 [Lactobacillus delbrueckii subsp. allosunkii]|uniref:Uncharacterized protein n=2 Tax=Lactobacillus delbrueckii TaxID=1584 RepID=A0ABD4SD20_9LACO|nr:hypothetical protein [Lactobacillus delbrueckii]EFK31938.1 hypothetical protein HMPREF9264_0447 [Lactobacillus delbrueckii subsp. bulgaricus PB2003/044-T3-4]MCD5518057.1 hypothetical protein [Lactobacillus delbrueckii subsp. sunkii]MCD5535959.1 hypothetical protein [Lactobacillus delbrueckii subsp. sunkii]MCZ0777510.1 hypothetical protein [Lactobacillus delbrueckii subsp. sunkii]MCZ0788113.1 hypothetical protein [Lactobacillus delbrueckii subsp. sunkii]
MNGQKLSGLNQQARVMFQDDRLLARVGLEEYADAYPATLSGGAKTKSCFSQSPPVLSPAPAFGQPPRSP